MDVKRYERDKLQDEFGWVGKENWDKVIVEELKYNTDYNSKSIIEPITITDKKLINSFLGDFLLTEEIYLPIHGFLSTVPRYKYTFISGNKTFQIAVEDENTIGIGTGNYDTTRYFTLPIAHLLGDAFTPSSKWEEASNIETKIANSQLIIKPNTSDLNFEYLQYKSVRTLWVAESISKAKLLSAKPKEINVDENKKDFIAYYFGNQIVLNPYGKYLNIIDGNKNYWYEFESTDGEEFDVNQMFVLQLWTAG